MTSTLRPKALHLDDMIGIFSPSEPLTKERQGRMQESLDLLARNFKYRFATHALAQTSYMAGSPEERIADITELLYDDGVQALMGSWGGKSANQLLSALPYEGFLQARKPIIGFSDVCVLLNAVTAQTGLITFAGPNIAGKLQESAHWNLGLITGRTEPPFGQTARENWETVVPGHATGRLFGGNLSTFVLGLAGTPSMERMEEVVFFWESASEPPQIIDQYLACLGNCGFLGRVKAMIVGDVSYQEESRKARPVNDVIRQYAEQYGFPAVRVETFGHHKMENPAVPIGCKVELDTHRKWVTCTEAAVD